MMNMMNNQDQLMKRVNTTSFAVNDAALFLDTHPDNRTALEYFDKYNMMRNQAVKDYEDQIGPLTIDGVKPSSEVWTWTQQPWPWEAGK